MPKPSAILTAVSLGVIATSIMVISFAIAAFMQTWNPCAMMSGIILMPLPMALAIQQYRGTFRRNRSAAKNTSTLLFVVSGFSAFAFVTTVG